MNTTTDLNDNQVKELFKRMGLPFDDFMIFMRNKTLQSNNDGMTWFPMKFIEAFINHKEKTPLPRKMNVIVVVQEPSECGADFGKRLAQICEDNFIEHEDSWMLPWIQFMTSDSSGRQTATLQFSTRINDNINKDRQQ